MNILFTRFPLEAIPGGGAETQVESLATGLAERGHSVTFAGSCPALGSAFRSKNFPVVSLDVGPPPVSKTTIARFALRKRSMRAALERMLDDFSKLDVIVMLSLTEKLLLTDIAAKRGITVVWIEHDPVGRWLRKNPWRKLLLRVSALATTITVSELSRIEYLEMDWNPKKTVAIPNGISDRWFIEKKGKGSSHGTLHLGYIGRLATEKGVDLLLRAIADVDHVTLDIVGNGPEKHMLKKQTQRLGIEHRVRFLGRTDDVAHVYRVIDALVLPSRTNDPFGLVVAEAMAMGVPCLVTDACGIAAHLDAQRDVIVVRGDDVDALVGGIQTLQDAEKRAILSKNGAKAARQQFKVSTMVDRYETLFTGKPQ